MTQSSRLVPLGPFVSGIDNRLPAHAMEDPDPRSLKPLLRSAVNVDVTNAGTLKRRRGTSRVMMGSDCHSLFSVPGAQAGYVVDFADLIYLTGAPGALARTVVRNDLSPGRRVSYAVHPDGSILYTNGVTIGRLRGAQALPLNVPAVASPFVSYSAAGSLPAGRYQVATALRDLVTGELGPASTPLAVSLTQAGRIDVTSPPAPAGYELVIYMTPPNGSVLMEVATGTPAATFSVLPSFGARCFTLMKRPLPPGAIVRYYNGRTLVAAGNVLFYSDVYSPLMTPSEGYVVFPSTITLMEPCQAGVFVGSDQTYWLAGDLSDAAMNPVLPYGAVSNTGAEVPNQNACWWLSARGIVVGKPDGSVQNLQEERVVVPSFGSGASAFIERDGMKQMVAPAFSPSSSRASAESWMEAEVFRKGNEL